MWVPIQSMLTHIHNLSKNDIHATYIKEVNWILHYYKISVKLVSHSAVPVLMLIVFILSK